MLSNLVIEVLEKKIACNEVLSRSVRIPTQIVWFSR